MTIEERFNLIKRNTAEILTEEELMELLKTKKEPVVYLGNEPTGRPHIGYLIPAIKIKDFVDAGVKVKILLADMHAVLNNLKSTFELVDKRTEFYKIELNALYKAIGVDVSKIEYIKGSDFELNREYTFDMYKLATLTSFERAQHAASELVKFDSGAKLSGFLYPILQTLDEEYLECDMQYGGLDQRKVFGFARESHPKIGQRKRIGVMTPMLPGIMGGKMSSSDPSSKIDLLDSSDDIETKLNKAFCPEGVVENNGIMAFMKYVIMVLKGDKGEKFAVGRDEKFGGNVEYSNYEELEKDFVAKKLHPADLKKALARELAEILKPVREAFKNKQDLIKEAYPEK